MSDGISTPSPTSPDCHPQGSLRTPETPISTAQPTRSGPIFSRRSLLVGSAVAGLGLAGLRTPAMALDARFPGDPGIGKLYYGLNTAGGDPSGREAFFGHRVGCYRSYFRADQADYMVAICKRDLAAGRQPMVSIANPGTWDAVSKGTYDASWLRPLMSKLATVPGPVWLCIHHEPYFDIGPGQDDATYRAMYRHAAIYKPSNVAFMPILGLVSYDKTEHGSQTNIAKWYALDVIDIVGADTYNHWWKGSRYWVWRSAATTFAFFDELAKMGKPIALNEYGTRTDPNQPGRAATWMAQAHDLLVKRGDVVAMSYFDWPGKVDDGGPPWQLDYAGNRERLYAFKRQLTAPGSVFRPL
jgi:hypothetical protein